ncbi:MAG: hypothetical protein [Circular genetic element sp.]|nr:MAG: hypothetical protein [Circular genetic element sp.]
MNDEQFIVVWIMSFLLYLVIYTFWIPLKTQKKIETWLLSKESDNALNQGLEVIVKSIREQTLHDFEEFMLPRARESLKKFWGGAMGNAAKELGKGEEGSQLSLLHNMTKDLSGQPWYIQAAASKLLPIMQNAAKTDSNAVKTLSEGMGLQK